MKRLNVNAAGTPFVNRVVPVTAMAGLGALALVLTIVNLTSFIVLGADFRSQRSELREKEKRLQLLKKDMEEKQKQLESSSVASLAGEAQFVSGVLDLKRFSWTRFFEDLERVKPFGVLMEGVTPTLGRDGLVLVTLRGKANQRSELLKFEQNLMGDASFRGFELQNEQKEQGSPFIVFNITVNYIPGGKP